MFSLMHYLFLNYHTVVNLAIVSTNIPFERGMNLCELQYTVTTM